jgi:iduronate 2-sulfatase
MQHIRYLVALFSCLLLHTLPASATDPQPPNVLLICVDDLKPLLGCYGDPHAQTPALDRLAARGIRFTSAYCNQAVCSPSRNALLTSLRPQTLGIYDLATNFRRSAPAAVTLGQHFRNHGYHTESLGKIFHVGHGNQDDADSWSVPSWKPKGSQYALAENAAAQPPVTDLKSTKKGSGKKKAKAASDPKGTAWESADVPDTQYADGKIAAEAILRLQAAKERGQPFLLAVGFLKPHLPFVAPKKYWDLYQPASLPLANLQKPPEDAPPWAPQFGGELRNYRGLPSAGTLPQELQRTLIHGYYAAMSYMDAQAGKVLAELERLELHNNTIVVLWGDHGWHLGDHGMWCKHTNYEQAARIPLVISLPKAQVTGSTQAIVETVDLYPTLAELAGLPAPAKVDGQSFAAVLKNPAAEHRDHAIHVYPRSGPNGQSLLGRAIRTASHRLVEWKTPGAPAESATLELYDYSTDPLETRNLAKHQPEVVTRLRKLLDQHPEPTPPLPSQGRGAGGEGSNAPQ